MPSTYLIVAVDLHCAGGGERDAAFEEAGERNGNRLESSGDRVCRQNQMRPVGGGRIPGQWGTGDALLVVGEHT